MELGRVQTLSIPLNDSPRFATLDVTRMRLEAHSNVEITPLQILMRRASTRPFLLPRSALGCRVMLGSHAREFVERSSAASRISSQLLCPVRFDKAQLVERFSSDNACASAAGSFVCRSRITA